MFSFVLSCGIGWSSDNPFDRKPDLLQQAAGDFTLQEMIGRRYTLSFRAAF